MMPLLAHRNISAQATAWFSDDRPIVVRGKGINTYYLNMRLVDSQNTYIYLLLSLVLLFGHLNFG